MKHRTAIVMTCVALAAAVTAHAEPGDERFLGGSYDGWDRDMMAESAGLDPVPKGTVIMFW
jgi:hypothetical protein